MLPSAQLAVVVRWLASNGMNMKGKKQKIPGATKIHRVSPQRPGLGLDLKR
jgi:hypothetical protein